MLSKFMGIEDAYLILQEFEEICTMMCYHNVPVDTV